MELQELYGLMERFAASGLTELEWQKKDERVCLRRAPAQVVQAAPAAAPAVCFADIIPNNAPRVQILSVRRCLHCVN